MLDLGALAYRREGTAVKDTQHAALSEQLTGLRKRKKINIHTTYYESFLALSVSIRVDRHQLMMETPSSSQAPVLRCRDITFTTEYLKESLSAVCPLLGVHNVARVRQGATLPLVEVDFTDEKALKRFCESISNGMFYVRLSSSMVPGYKICL